jgi:hypothetical protein
MEKIDKFDLNIISCLQKDGARCRNANWPIASACRKTPAGAGCSA